jgi:hypothetical protein
MVDVKLEESAPLNLIAVFMAVAIVATQAKERVRVGLLVGQDGGEIHGVGERLP